MIHLAVLVTFSDTLTPTLKNSLKPFAITTKDSTATIYTRKILTGTRKKVASKNEVALFYASISEQRPDSIYLSTGSKAVTLLLLPEQHNSGKVLDTLLKTDSLMMSELAATELTVTVYRHTIENRSKVDTTINASANIKITPETSETSDTRKISLVYFNTIPTDTALLRSILKNGYFVTSPTHVVTSGTPVISRHWKSDTTKTGFRMPTEAEWNSAALCGQGLAYSTYNGKATSESAVIEGSGPLSVASKKANPWGFYDLTGNLFEWVEDYFWTRAVNGVKNIDSLDLRQSPYRSIKGGYFANAQSDSLLKCTTAFSVLPDSLSIKSGQGKIIGMRVALPYRSADIGFWNKIQGK